MGRLRDLTVSHDLLGVAEVVPGGRLAAAAAEEATEWAAESGAMTSAADALSAAIHNSLSELARADEQLAGSVGTRTSASSLRAGPATGLR